MLDKIWDQLFSINGVVLISLLTYVINTAKGWFNTVWNFFMMRYEMNLQSQSYDVKMSIIKYLKMKNINNPNFVFNRNMKINCNNLENDDAFIPYGSYIIKLNWCMWVLLSHYKHESNTTNTELTEYMSYINVTFYGFNRKYWFDDLLNFIKTDNLEANIVRVYPAAYYISYHKDIFDTNLFGKSNLVLDKIDKFIKSEDFYKKYKRPYKFNILLYGEPGTGKTTTIKHVIHKFGIKNVFNIDTKSIYTIDDIAHKLVNFSREHLSGKKLPPTLIHIEDIDKLIYNDLGNLDDKILHNLMQILDGMSTQYNTITILTTNYIDKLPKPLIRTGRIDYRLELGKYTREEAEEVVKFYESDLSILEDKQEFNPSELENKLYNNVFNKHFKL